MGEGRLDPGIRDTLNQDRALFRCHHTSGHNLRHLAHQTGGRDPTRCGTSQTDIAWDRNVPIYPRRVSLQKSGAYNTHPTLPTQTRGQLSTFTWALVDSSH